LSEAAFEGANLFAKGGGMNDEHTSSAIPFANKFA
ncbi:hypothetical protein PSYJA_46576, partial [Pseudomonas syringae pv. japonica str. M301072]